MSKTMSKSGELREFLANMMVGVKNGEVKIDEARTIVKLAEKINESFYSEIKVAQIGVQLARKVAELGELPINK